MSSTRTTGDTVSGVVSAFRSWKMSLSNHQLPVHRSAHTIRKSKLEFPHAGCHVSHVKKVSSALLSWEHSSPKWKSIGVPHSNTTLFRYCEKVTKRCPLLLVGWSVHSSSCFACSVSCPPNYLCHSLSALYSCLLGFVYLAPYLTRSSCSLAACSVFYGLHLFSHTHSLNRCS